MKCGGTSLRFRRLAAARRTAAAGGNLPHSPVIGPAALGGNHLLRAFPEEGVFFLALGPGSADATRRRAAEALCGGRVACRVYGFRDPGSVPMGPQLDAAARKYIAFTYVRRPPADRRVLPPSANAL